MKNIVKWPFDIKQVFQLFIGLLVIHDAFPGFKIAYHSSTLIFI